MLSSKKLLSVQEAAGYAMAPPPDESEAAAAVVVNRSLDDAMRLGHLSAAHAGRRSAADTLVISKAVIEPAKAALRGVVAGWWQGKAHA